jgi:enoyl-CoA hydratase
MSSVTNENGVAVVRLSAGKANAMGVEMLDQIRRAFDEVEASDATAAVVTGYDRYFSAGLALPELVDLDRPAMTRFIDLFSRTLARVFDCRLPVVAAVNGHAIAGGCVLALQADVRIMADVDVRIGLNEVNLGIGLPAVVVESLRYAVTPRALLPIAMEGRLLTPAQALELGLVDEVVPSGELEERATGRARALGGVPAGGFAHVKAALRRPAREARVRTEPEETERWLDTWFSPPARARLTETVRRLTSRGA